MKYLVYLVIFTSVFLSCTSPEPMSKAQTGVDPHSYSQPEIAKVTHLSWDAQVSFKERSITATATWTVDLNKNSEEVIFDSYRLVIKNVSLNGEEVSWRMSEFDEILGSALMVDVSGVEAQTVKIAIEYATPTSARALFWALPEQTFGKKNPFLFTQSQAILARTWIPCQDSPGIRFTYDAQVRVPNNMLALMSAENPQSKNESGEYKFQMSQPIPSYLMALAVGDIAYEAVGPRTGVYAEPGQLEAAAWEFDNMEQMLNDAERLYGPYAWGRYDVLVLPPSFPFGGMENPRLTFATPTIIAGDRSLTSLIAHELAHSWSGNLVTNKTWNDFWLNEGFTVYVENRIIEEIAGEDYAKMLAALGYSSLREEIEMLGEQSADTRLKLDLAGRDPDDGMTDIAYEKGFNLLKQIENAWGRENWDEFLKKYFSENKFQVMDTEAFLSKLQQAIGRELYDSLKVETWVYESGLPKTAEAPVSQRFKMVDNAFKDWKEGKDLPIAVVEKWTTHEWLRFIEGVPRDVNQNKLQELDQRFGLSKSGNSEIACAWMELAIYANYKAVDDRLREFLTRVGRRKFLMPLYRALKNTDRTEFALEIYREARPGYHAVSIESLDKLLNFNG
ncbi:MAG: M1 family metallopeptidase [Luteibaculum sp.]